MASSIGHSKERHHPQQYDVDIPCNAIASRRTKEIVVIAFFNSESAKMPASPTLPAAPTST